MHHVEASLRAGDATQCRGILDAVLTSTPEMLWSRSPEEARQYLIDSCVERPRVEIATYDGGRLVGFCVLVAEDDPNVGLCIGVIYSYVLPSHRGRVGGHYLRRALQLAALNDIPSVAYTHRLGEGQYAINYRRTQRNGQKHQQTS